MITSHFIWITLKKEIFIELFVKLLEYLKENNIDILNFQNILSLHTTIFYLWKDLGNKDVDMLKKDIDCFRDKLKNTRITVAWFDYFKYSKHWNQGLCFLSPNSNTNLTEINSFFKNKFKNDIKDNKNEFKEHVTLFKIKNNLIFEVHKKNIEKIIKDFIIKNKKVNIYENINLYLVSSKFDPQIQIPIY